MNMQSLGKRLGEITRYVRANEDDDVRDLLGRFHETFLIHYPSPDEVQKIGPEAQIHPEVLESFYMLDKLYTDRVSENGWSDYDLLTPPRPRSPYPCVRIIRGSLCIRGTIRPSQNYY